MIGSMQGRALTGMALAAVWTAGPVWADTLRLWTVEEQPERVAVQQEIADAFGEEFGHTVEVIPVSETDLGARATAAFAAGDLPDIIYHPVQYTLPWAEAGILDSEAGQEVVDELGPETFRSAALDMANFEGEVAAIPVDGWTQLIVYRKDLFDEAGLEAPTTFAAVEAAIEALHNPPELYGFVAATKIDEAYMSQVLEEVFLANGVSPVDENGFKPLDEARTTEVLEFYKKLGEASPPGDLYWDQARSVYFAGQAAMTFWSPFILDELAGLRDSDPPRINDDPTSTELASKTGVVTRFAGPSNPDGAAWADMRYWGITVDANIDAAADFVTYAMNEGYLKTLAMAPEGKFPVRNGTAEEPEAFIKGWADLEVGVDRKAPLSELYAPEIIEQIVAGLDVATRWGVKEGQLALASKMINSQVLNQITREFMDGRIDASAAVARMNEELGKIQ